MTLKNDENLQLLANAANTDPEKHGRELYKGMLEFGMIEHDPENIDRPIKQMIGNQRVKDICNFLSIFYGSSIKSTIFDAFCRLEIISEGCPYCGGELKLVDTEGHELPHCDYDTPPQYVVDEYIYRCAECGETVKTDQEL